MKWILSFFNKLFWWLNLTLLFLVGDFLTSKIKQDVKDGKTSKATVAVIIILYLAIFIGFQVLVYRAVF